MAKFEFQDNGIRLEIAGHVFCIPATVEAAKRLQEVGRGMQAKAQALSRREDAQAIEEALDFMWDGLDAILGAGASEMIFAGRERSIYDAIDVVTYVSQEFEAFQKEKQARYGVNPPSPTNRAQRRAVENASTVPFPTVKVQSPSLAPDVGALANDPRVLAAAMQALISQAANESAR